MATLQDSFYKLESGVPKYAKRITQPVKYDATSQLIRGTMSFSKQKLQELDPSYTGHTHIFVLRLPPFMTSIARNGAIEGYDTNAKAVAETHCRNLKTFIELGSTSYSGTPDLTLNTSEVNTGFSERSYPAPTFAAYDGKNFTIRCVETRAEPLRRAVEYYINGVSDANVKATTLHGAKEYSTGATNVTPMAPTLGNITFSIMVVQTDQELINIQDISIWNSCIITGIDRSNLDWENGTIDIVQPRDIQFNGVYMPDSQNKYITDVAYKLLGSRLKLFKRYQDMSEEDIGTASWNVTTDIYNSNK